MKIEEEIPLTRLRIANFLLYHSGEFFAFALAAGVSNKRWRLDTVPVSIGGHGCLRDWWCSSSLLIKAL